MRWSNKTSKIVLTASEFAWRPALIAVFNNKQPLKFKAQLTIVFFPSINQNYGDRQRTLKHRKEKQNGSKSSNHDRQTWPFDLAEVSFRFPSGPLRWLTVAKNVNRWLRFEFQSLLILKTAIIKPLRKYENHSLQPMEEIQMLVTWQGCVVVSEIQEMTC